MNDLERRLQVARSKVKWLNLPRIRGVNPMWELELNYWQKEIEKIEALLEPPN